MNLEQCPKCNKLILGVGGIQVGGEQATHCQCPPENINSFSSENNQRITLANIINTSAGATGIGYLYNDNGNSVACVEVNPKDTEIQTLKTELAKYKHIGYSYIIMEDGEAVHAMCLIGEKDFIESIGGFKFRPVFCIKS